MCTFKHPVYESEHHGAGNINIFGHWYTVAIVKAIHNKSKSAEIGFMWSFKSRTSPLWISLTRAFALWTPFKVFQDFPGYKIKSPRRKTCFPKKMYSHQCRQLLSMILQLACRSMNHRPRNRRLSWKKISCHREKESILAGFS